MINKFKKITYHQSGKSSVRAGIVVEDCKLLIKLTIGLEINCDSLIWAHKEALTIDNKLFLILSSFDTTEINV